MKYTVFASLYEEIDAGWVWLGTPPLSPRCIVRLRNTLSGKTVYCEALQFDRNFLQRYRDSEDRLPIDFPASAIVINAWYRTLLGGISTTSEHDLEVVSFDNSWGHLLACLQHPQAVVRLSTWLALLSFALGAAGILIAFS